jgi:hypothetical protein
MYEQILHVPLLVWHPHQTGARVEQPVSLVDIGPSAARWLNLDFRPRDWPGQYLEDAIVPRPGAEERVLYASGIAYGEQQVSVRRGNQKSVWFAEARDSDFFDLATDPAEVQPLGAPRWALHFDGYLVDYTDSIRATTSAPATISDQQIKRLQAIGYLQNADTKEAASEPDPESDESPPQGSASP